MLHTTMFLVSNLDFRGNRSLLILLNSFNIRIEILRQSLKFMFGYHCWSK